MHLKNWIARFEEIERSILEAPGAVWDVQLAKLICVFLGLAAAKAFPSILALDLHWYLIVASAFALRPAIRAAVLVTRKI